MYLEHENSHIMTVNIHAENHTVYNGREEK